jgi:hypothetical protein
MISVIHLKGSFKYDLSIKEKKVERIKLLKETTLVALALLKTS